MPAELSTVATIRAQALAELAELVDEPEHTSSEAAAVWATSIAALRQLVDWCDTKLGDGQPFELRSQATT